jgi:hypothetical protein
MSSSAPEATSSSSRRARTASGPPLIVERFVCARIAACCGSGRKAIAVSTDGSGPGRPERSMTIDSAPEEPRRSPCSSSSPTTTDVVRIAYGRSKSPGTNASRYWRSAGTAPPGLMCAAKAKPRPEAAASCAE